LTFPFYCSTTSEAPNRYQRNEASNQTQGNAMAQADIPTVVLSYKYRLRPNKAQHAALRLICEQQRELYNGALEERVDCYRKTGKGRAYMDQCKSLTELRSDPDFSAIPLNVQRWTLKRVDAAFAGFFSRLKRGERPGFPRYRSRARWSSFGFNEFQGIRLSGRSLSFKGLPGDREFFSFSRWPA
jgi:putative transposase